MQIYEDRRALHRIPELGLRLPKTVAYVTGSLEKFSCQVFHPMESAVCAFFDYGCDSTIAFRADMDALPVTEKTGLPFASLHNGAMHACGHDGHTAIALELARRLDKKKLDRNVLLIFQPGEESPGGAKAICETGIFEKYRVEAIFGLHLWPGLGAGKIFSRPGELMSRSSEVTVKVTGRSAHVGKSEQALDALAAATTFYTQAVAMEKAIAPGIRRLLKFCRMEGGTAHNIIAGSVTLSGSMRAYDDGVFDAMANGLHSIAEQVEKDTGCSVAIHMTEGYPAVCNPPEVYEKASRIADIQLLEEPSMPSEDFSWYQRVVPGMFFFLGVGDTPALHADHFDFDESVLVTGADFLEALAQQYR